MSLDIGKVFYHKLLNRNELQGDGKNTAVDFRVKYLGDLDSEAWWKSSNSKIELDFANVEVIGPSWANEIFAYYLGKGVKKKDILEKIICLNLTKTKEIIINREIDQGYRGY